MILILLALFILVALWMMGSLDPTSHTPAGFWLINQLMQDIDSIMTILSGLTSWMISQFWGILGNSG